MQDKNRIYSLRGPEVYCIAKGREHKEQEFGAEVSAATTKSSVVIVSAKAHETNIYEGDIFPEMLELAEVDMDRPIKKAVVDRGYRGRR